MADPLPLEGRSQRVKCEGQPCDLYMLSADISEGIDRLSDFSVEFLAEKPDLDSRDFLAKSFTLEMDLEADVRKWFGTCVECTFLGMSAGMGFGTYPHYRVRLRAWPWLLTRTANCRIFQDLTADEIIKVVLRDAGFSDHSWSVSETPPLREYCVQYRESDWDFIRRLLEEEGRFFYFDYSSGKDQLTIRDDSATLSPIAGDPNIEMIDKEAGQRSEIDYIDNWKDGYRVDTDKVTLDDYDFIKSKTKLTGTRMDDAEKLEVFDYPGRFKESAIGTKRARRRMEAIIAGKNRVWGQGIVKAMTPAGKFTLKEHPARAQNKEYLVLDLKQKLRIEQTEEWRDKSRSGKYDPKALIESQTIELIAQDAKIAYVPVSTVPWPVIHGIQTAVVVGPSGDEIYTDEHGRVKVQFFWDREGQLDDKSSCFIRVATPIAGKNWGMIHIPRIGQEVVVQFLEGDPDRPLIVGSVYNDQQTTPFTLPENKTQIGLVSDTHQNEDTNAKHEFVLEEKKDNEFIRMQSEKDYFQIIKNNADVKIGDGSKDDGDYTQSVWRNTVRDYGVKSGEGNLTETVQTDFSKTISDGDYTLSVETGGRTTDIASDDTLSVDGKIDVTSNQTITLTANSSIKLVCGGSTLELTSSAIKLTSTQFKVEGSQVKVAGSMVDVSGSLIKMAGALVKIN
ncbi:type VI secretion system Vgr family protein [Neptunicoccus sediminis]|uniref:type VI secretion system Vgr family protein n=1 Tax=Neptunicoccus sediminis TaxID=1892596 RepID=UPI000845FC47|nr:type VI secretion system tip protein TssI/VgrG [Neptunicoccus sediminis]